MPTKVLRDPEHVTAKLCACCGAAFTRDPRYSRLYFSRQKYCSQKCSGDHFRARNAEIYGEPKERFLSSIQRRDDGCWQWTGSISSAGYGTITIAGKRQYAHRFSLKNFGSGIKKGQMACHKCDRPWCVNPDHLYAGDAKTNGVDAAKRQRLSHQRLTEADVRAIYHSPKQPTEIAAEYGVTASMVSAIRHRRKWRHVDVGHAH